MIGLWRKHKYVMECNTVLHFLSIYRGLNLIKTCVCLGLFFFVAVIEFAAQIERVSSLEAITKLRVHRSVTVAFSSLLFIILLKNIINKKSCDRSCVHFVISGHSWCFWKLEKHHSCPYTMYHEMHSRSYDLDIRIVSNFFYLQLFLTENSGYGLNHATDIHKRSGFNSVHWREGQGGYKHTQQQAQGTLVTCFRLHRGSRSIFCQRTSEICLAIEANYISYCLLLLVVQACEKNNSQFLRVFSIEFL